MGSVFMAILGLPGNLESFYIGRNSHSAVSEFNFEGVALFALEIDVGDLGGDDDGEVGLLSAVLDEDFDDRPGVAGPAGEEFAFHAVFVAPEAVAIVEGFPDEEWGDIVKGGCFLPQEEGAEADKNDDGGDDADDGGGIDAGAGAATHVGGG